MVMVLKFTLKIDIFLVNNKLFDFIFCYNILLAFLDIHLTFYGPIPLIRTRNTNGSSGCFV